MVCLCRVGEECVIYCGKIVKLKSFFYLMLKELVPIFGTQTKAQEILFLLKDLKAVVRQGFYEPELPAVEKFCQENKFFLVKSKFKVFLAEESNYSNKGIRLPLEDPRPGLFFVYISKDEEKAWLATFYEQIGNDYELGLLLGYPECCVRFFVNNFNENKTNLQLPPQNIYTNLTQREDDFVLLSHFPCSADCPESIKLGKKYLALLEKEDSIRANSLKEHLEIRD